MQKKISWYLCKVSTMIIIATRIVDKATYTTSRVEAKSILDLLKRLINNNKNFRSNKYY
ncbi:hypothetical protein [Spiroplasma floricola]|uniref:hypothetical protein n=1 Tax=Spiroplasma floricola TaxID=216937 RepID=UPI0012FDA527|nr:hypothetical protein [Spiroplasma floricola]